MRPEDSGPDAYEIPHYPQPPARGVVAALLRLLPAYRRIVDQRDELRAERIDWRARNDMLHVLLDEEHARGNEMMQELVRLRRLELVRDMEAQGIASMSWVFIVTYGRSGSTLLQGMLNSAPGVLIRGENAGMVRHLWHYHRTAVDRRDQPWGSRFVSPRHPWYGIDGYPVDVALHLLRVLVLETLLRPHADTRVSGFKEIDWPEEDLDEYVDFLRLLFPKAKFLVNTRNLDATAQSGWWADQPDARELLEAREQRYLELRDRLGDDARHVRYDDYVADVTTLEPVFDWIGASFDAGIAERVLSLQHSYDTRQEFEG